ncbi:hypothetical protein PSECIP111854_00070 [Pseudoalteromonas sp. CIP111854]|uniref:Uncharacterized protein n=1 Tax=Pseudoalteromonas holothuriae TaxID=2963714 RepID=A0A9W4VQM8_9GAMM|nr:hypothetical protein [Pseudoalteromonas sp. CIP111854]CAH9049437.1 hypothetical protein PSECIP111854_00070 [Pseudoalteromonas sp. CIP111854]
MIEITRRIALLASFCMFTLHVLAHEATFQNNEGLDDKLAKLIKQHELIGDFTSNVNIPSVNDPEVKLGKLLLFSKALRMLPVQAVITLT